MSGDPLNPPGPGEPFPPPEVDLRGFVIVWIDGDRRDSQFSEVSGSKIEDGFLTLFLQDRGEVAMINLSQVAQIISWDES